MQTTCSNCSSTIHSTDGAAPKFCSECGTPLSTQFSVVPDNDDPGSTEAETLTRMPGPRNNTHAQDIQVRQNVDPLLQETIGPYRLVRKLGQGGMGSVYEAIHDETDQAVALKLLMPALRKTDESIQRFKRESQIAASINHPRSTFVYEAGEYRDQFYITMELMDGGTLKDIVAEDGPLEVTRAVDYILDIIDGLTIAHVAGIVHRDLKPSNCFIDHDGRVKIGDFGLAKSFLGESDLTQTGTFMGTPQYAAPEQLRASEVDERADIYALGATLFYLLAGRAAFTGNPAQVIAGIASEIPPRVSKFAEHVPRDLVRLIAQTLEKSPSKRPQKLEILRDILQPYSSRGTSLADIGRRMAAFFIDITLAGSIAQISSALFVFIAMIGFGVAQGSGQQATVQFIAIVFQTASVIGYFAIAESVWGRGVGKWLMGMRVIGSNAEPPSLFNATLRASIIPGLSWICNLAMTMWIVSPVVGDVQAGIDLLTEVQVVSLLSWIPTLLCMLTARQFNGYLGIHELVSGTRVARLSGDLEFRRLDTIPTTVPVPLESPLQFGTFEATGWFVAKHSGSPSVYMGTDPLLERDIWIFDEIPEDSISEVRRSTKRPNRLRVISSGQQDDRNWLATEAVRGLPLYEALRKKECDWQSARPLFLELAAELRQSAADGILPKDLNINLVWIDEVGRIKLLDFPVTFVRIVSKKSSKNVGLKKKQPIVAEVSASPGDTNNSEPNEYGVANRLFLELFEHYTSNHNLPVHVIELKNKVKEIQDKPTALEWVSRRLADLAERPSNWKWDDRLGVLAISAGLEFSFVTTIVYLIGFLCVSAEANEIALCISTVGIGAAVAYLLGHYLDGGVAFRLADIAVLRNKDYRIASRIRCGIRSVIAWIPTILTNSFLFYLMFSQLEATANTVTFNDSYYFIVFGFMVILILCMANLMGIVLALFSPARSIHDWIVGTRLARK